MHTMYSLYTPHTYKRATTNRCMIKYVLNTVNIHHMHTNTPKKKTQNKKWWIAAHPEAQWQTCQDKKQKKTKKNMPKKKSGG